MVTPVVTEPTPETVQPTPGANLLDLTQEEVAVAAALEPGGAAPAVVTIPTPSSQSSVPAATPAPPPQSQDELATLRRQVAQYEAERESQASEAALNRESQQVHREALARGLTDEDATWIAQRYYTVARRANEEQQRFRQEEMYRQGKQNAAVQIGREYGVDPTILMVGDSPQTMRAIADREKKYLAQDVRLKALEQKQVPAQALDAASGSRAGALAVTPDNIDKLWFDYETQHPGTANPYDGQYRKLLGIG